MTGKSHAGLRLPEQKRGPHRSATPKDMHMKISTIAAMPQAHPFIREGTLRLNPAQANRVFTDLRYEFNRDEKKAKQHISGLARMMRSGAWREGGAIEFARLPSGQLTLVDGHHRMLAQVEAGVDVVWTIIIHDVADEADLRNLFWTYDTTLRKRSMQNVLAGVNASGAMGLSAMMAHTAAKAAVFIDNGMRPNNGPSTRAYTPDETLRLAAEWAAEARLYAECIDAAPVAMKRKLRGGQIAAAGFITFRANRLLAVDFWTGLARDDGLRRGDPRKTLLEWMRDTHMAGGGLSSGACAVARAWNAFHANSDLTMIRIGRQSVRIAGSSFVVRP